MGAVCCMNDEDTGDSLVKVRVNVRDPEQEEVMAANSPEVVRLHKILQEISSKRSVTSSFLDKLYDSDGQEIRKAAILDEVCCWKVVYGEAHPVFAEKTSEIRQMIGVRQLGDVVRAYQDGEWLVLADQLGFMRMVTACGMPVLERIPDAYAAQATKSTESNDMCEQTSVQIQESKVDKGAPRGISDTFNEQTSDLSENASSAAVVANGSREICSWVVVYKNRFPIHSDTSKQTLFLGVKQPGEVFRGHQMGNWVALANEPGYIRIVAANSGTTVLEKVDNPAGDNVPMQEHKGSLATTSSSSPLDKDCSKHVTKHSNPGGAESYAFGHAQPALMSSSI